MPQIEHLEPVTSGDEDARLRDLASYLVVGTDAEEEFDHLAALAAEFFNTPIAVVTLIDRDRAWLKASHGLSLRDGPRHLSFSHHTIQGRTVMTVPDAEQDPRFAANPFVTGEPSIRFYAGAPLLSDTGRRLGALCVMDRQPRGPLTRSQERVLEKLAEIISRRLATRRDHIVRSVIHDFADQTSAAMLVIDDHGMIIFSNQAADHLLGYAPKDLIGQNIECIIPQRFREAHVKGVSRLREGAASKLVGKTIELLALRRDGTEIPVEFVLCISQGARGLSMTAIMKDITDRKRQDAKLMRLAHHDALTGLPNRLQLSDALGDVISVGGSAGLLMIDLDGFKQINDSFGHATGDVLLQTVAIRLASAIEPGALLARFGGDEFVIVLAATADPLRVEACATAILQALARPFDLGGLSVMVGASIGASIGPQDGSTADDLLACADVALYRAKNDGGHGFRLFDRTMRDNVLAVRALQDDLRRAIRQGELELHYQPQVSLRTGGTVGLEALLRWRHPDRGLLLPGVFLQAIESGSLALQIGWWTLNEACRQVAEWRARGLPAVRVAVNLFAAQLRVGNLFDVVVDILKVHGLPPDALELEITETIALQYDGRMVNPLSDLRKLGVGIAFDDFGTGYASLSTLRRFPISVLKIDRTFIRDLLSDPQDEAIVRAMITMGRDLNLHVIAEGIETEGQALALTRMACDSVQGFLYGRPMPAAELFKAETRAARQEPDGPAWAAVA